MKSLSRARLLATPWTVAHPAPLSIGFPRQEYWSELPFPTLGDPPDSGIKPVSLPLVGGVSALLAVALLFIYFLFF